MQLDTQLTATCTGGPRDGDVLTFHEGDAMHRLGLLVWAGEHVYKLVWHVGREAGYKLEYRGKCSMSPPEGATCN